MLVEDGYVLGALCRHGQQCHDEREGAQQDKSGAMAMANGHEWSPVMAHCPVMVNAAQ